MIKYNFSTKCLIYSKYNVARNCVFQFSAEKKIVVTRNMNYLVDVDRLKCFLFWQKSECLWYY